jgi:8-oxo-dGTP diphosphatase
VSAPATALEAGLLGVVHAAGAVVWRERAGRLEVSLVHRPRYKDWSWPKGKLDPGESVPAAAAREVAEEIGQDVVLGVPLATLRYRTPDGRGKQVRYWSARAADDDHGPALRARGPVEQAPWTEIDDVVWVSLPTAAELLTRASDRKPLEMLEGLWSAGRLRTRVVAVARHGQARPRRAWKGGEETRPLTRLGQLQAEALVPVLAAFGIRGVVTSPWERCLHTVQPYAERSGVPVETVEALTEAAFARDPALSAEVIAEHLDRPRDELLSTHRPVLPALFKAVDRECRKWTLGGVPTADPYLRTGEVLIAHVAGAGESSRVVAIERHRPPHPPVQPVRKPGR